MIFDINNNKRAALRLLEAVRKKLCVKVPLRPDKMIN